MKKNTSHLLLSVIIVSYNTRSYTLQTLRSCIRDIKQSSLLQHESEVVVIDNNSSDGSVQAISELIPQSPVPLILIKNKTNSGFAAANNDGIKKARGKYLFLLNSDTYVQANALEKLVTCFLEHPSEPNQPKLGLVAATLLNSDGTIQAQGGNFPSLLSLFCQMTLLDDIPVIGQFLPSIQHTGKRATHAISATSTTTKLIHQDWVGATAVLIDAELFKDCDGFDQAIFMYAEDIELCLRAAHHGWIAAIHPSARVTHYGQQSSSPEAAIRGEYRGLLYIWSKHLPLWQVPFAKTLLQLGALIRTIIFGTIKQNQGKVIVYRQLLAELLEE